MSEQLYNRVASVEIGRSGEEGIRISKLRISFSVKKPDPSRKQRNSATVKIYNMSEQSRNSIKETEDVLILKAGYADSEGEKVIFTGDITTINHEHDSPNIITTIDCNDGDKILRDGVITLTHKDGAGTKQILQEVINKLNLPKKINTALLDIADKKYATGFAFAGQSKVALDKLAEVAGFNWSIQNNELKIVDKNKTDKSIAISLSSTTGMIGSPTRINDIYGKKDGKKSVRGWKIQSLLQPITEPDSGAIVGSKEIPSGSLFKIVDVEHRGDTHGQEFFTFLKVKEI